LIAQKAYGNPSSQFYYFKWEKPMGESKKDPLRVGIERKMWNKKTCFPANFQ